MKKREYSVAALIVFILGLAVLAAAFPLLSPLFEDTRPQFIFSFVCAALLYLAFFLPFLTGMFKGGIASAAASGAVYFKGFSTYFVITAADIALAFTVAPLGVVIAIQSAALFIFAIWLFMAVVTKGHVTSVQSEEDMKKAPVMALRSRAGRLSALAAELDGNSAVRVWAEKTAENMRYLSPGNTANERELELKMLSVLDSIIADGYFAGAGSGSVEPLEMKFRSFDALYGERKNMR